VNSLITGLVGGAAGVGLLNHVSGGTRSLFAAARRSLYVECVLDNEETAYHWAMRWLSERPEVRQSGAVRAICVWANDDMLVELAPGDGDHLIRYNGRRFWISHATHDSEMNVRRRTLRLRCAKRHRPVLVELLQEIAARERQPDPTRTKIYVPENGAWRVHTQKPMRTPDSIILDGGMVDDMIQAVTEFVGSEARCRARGIPHRFGILLAGPPGNGKSSIALMVAGALGRGLHVLGLGDQFLDDAKVTLLMGEAKRDVVLLEDVDTVFHGRDRVSENKLTLAGLLGAIDGPLAAEGRVLIMTTNHPERLDPALVRPGRADRRYHIGDATSDQARRMALRFFPGDDLFAGSFAREWTGKSMAALQCALMEQSAERDRPARATKPRRLLEMQVTA